MPTPLFIKYALREIRGGLKGLYIFIICLIVGVAGISVSRSLNYAVKTGLDANSKSILGGDVMVSFSNRYANDNELAFFKKYGKVSLNVETRSMARNADNDKRLLIELKAVDNFYPLYGEVILTNNNQLAHLLQKQNDYYGLVAEKGFFLRLGINIGDIVRIGNLDFEARDILEFEPDNVQSLINLGPRVIIDVNAINEALVMTAGAIASRRYAIALNPNIAASDFKNLMEKDFPESSFRIRTIENASPRIERFFDNMVMYLTLIGLATLVVGGIGIGGAVKAWLDSKMMTIATLKCLGAEEKHIFLIYLTQIILFSIISILVGLFVGLAALNFAINLVKIYLPSSDVRFGIYYIPLMQSAAFGILVAIIFSLLPLSKACLIKPSSLFRNIAVLTQKRYRLSHILIELFCVAFLIILAVMTSEKKLFALGFVLSSVFAIILFVIIADVIIKTAQKLLHFKKNTALRVALFNLCRQGSKTTSIVLSMGLGLTVLITVTQLENNIDFHIKDGIPEKAPSFFFLDIQAEQKERFMEIVNKTENAKITAIAPMTKARVTHLNGIPSDKAKISQDVEWAVRGDRGLSGASAMPEKTEVVKGKWWEADYDGEPLVSVVRSTAEGLGLDIGSTVSFNVVGMPITATVTSFREVNWKTGAMNFAFLLNENAFKDFPYNYISTVTISDLSSDIIKDEDLLEKNIVENLPNVSSIRLRAVMENLNNFFETAGVAIKMASLVAIFSGIIVLSGAIASGHKRRIYEAVVFKVLGAKKIDVLKIFSAEYGILGIVSALFAIVLGSIAAKLVLENLMDLKWFFFIKPSLITAAICVIIMLGAGFLGTFLALNKKASKLLRNE